MTLLERRTIAIDSPVGRTLSGLAVPYGKWSREISEPFAPQFREKIARGAFGDLAGADIKLLWNHNPGALLARTRSGTLTITDTAAGLRFSADLADTTVGRDVRELIARGDLSGEMSFGFHVIEDSWSKDRSQRLVKRAALVEVSIVQDAAYPQTSSSLRSVSAAYTEAVYARLALHFRRMSDYV